MAAPLAALIPLLGKIGAAVMGKTAAATAGATTAKAAATMAVAAKSGVSAAATAAKPAAVFPTPSPAVAARAGAKVPFQVLEDPSTGASARDLTKMLSGRPDKPPVRRAPIAQAVPPVEPASPPPPLDPARAISRKAAVQPQKPGAQPSQRTYPPQKPGAQPSAPKGPVQSAVDRFREWRQARASNRAEAQLLKTPVTQQIKGMTLPERTERLQQAGRLLDPAEVTRQTGIEEPGQRDIVQASERNQERERVARLEQLNQAFGNLETPMQHFKMGLLLLGAPGLFLAVTKALSGFTKGVIASNESLRRFDPAIAQSIAQMERQDLILQARTARATSGSATAVNAQWMALRDETQGLHETVKTIYNILAAGAAMGLRVGNFLLQLSGTYQVIEKAASLYNRWMGSRQEGPMPYQEFIQDIINHGRQPRRDFDRNAGNGGQR